MRTEKALISLYIGNEPVRKTEVEETNGLTFVRADDPIQYFVRQTARTDRSARMRRMFCVCAENTCASHDAA